MARHPEWFERLDRIEEGVRQAEIEWFGRREIQAIFGCSERDSIRLLHKFGAKERDNVLSLPRTALLTQLGAIRTGNAYGSYVQQRQEVARRLSEAQSEMAARQFRVAPKVAEPVRARFQDLPGTIRLEPALHGAPGRLEIVYTDSGDLMRQLVNFLSVAGGNREEFLAVTEPCGEPSR
jgi:hypothetical protein